MDRFGFVRVPFFCIACAFCLAIGLFTASANGLYEVQPPIELDFEPESIEIGEFLPGHGVDLAIKDEEVQVVHLFRNIGHAQFVRDLSFDVSVEGHGFTVADFDENGWDDVVGIIATRLEIHLNSGSGFYSAPLLHTFPISEFRDTTSLGDLNGDGELDLISPGYFDVPVLVFRGLGGGEFQNPPSLVGVVSCSTAALADFDGDQDLDIGALDGSLSDVIIHVNDGNGNFTTTVRIEEIGILAPSVLAAHLNDDELPDLVLSGQDGLFVMYNLGAGQFSSATLIAAGHPFRLRFGDVDLDNDTDIVRIDRYGDDPGLDVFLNNGVGQPFSSIPYDLGGTDYSDAALGDLDGDGDLDIAVVDGHPNPDSLTVLLNNTKALLGARPISWGEIE